jgi:hypothetical protein
VKHLVDPASQRAALILAAVTLLLVPLLAIRTGAARGDVRIDEAHKISESAFFPLWMRLDFRNPAWTADIVDRSNPPVGKYLFGLSIVLSGQRVPNLPTLSIYAGDGLVPPLFPPELSRPYEQFLPAGRRVAIACTALIAAIVTWCTARIAGPIGATVAVVFLLTHFLTRIYGATAIFDPILALFATILLAIAASAAGARTRMRFAALMTAAGVAGALAFQTRLNGLLFFVVTLLVVLLIPRTRSDTIIGFAAASAAFVIVTLAVNPYYWPSPVTRFASQLSDLRVLLSRCGGRLTTLAAKVGFAWEIVCGDLQGLLLLLAAIAGVAALVVRWRNLARLDRLVGAWSVITIVAFIVWMPVPVQRYLLVTIPPLCCLSALGFSGAVALVKNVEPQSPRR